MVSVLTYLRFSLSSTKPTAVPNQIAFPLKHHGGGAHRNRDFVAVRGMHCTGVLQTLLWGAELTTRFRGRPLHPPTCLHQGYASFGLFSAGTKHMGIPVWAYSYSMGGSSKG